MTACMTSKPFAASAARTGCAGMNRFEAPAPRARGAVRAGLVAVFILAAGAAAPAARAGLSDTLVEHAARPELSGLTSEAKEALAAGRSVLLESAARDDGVDVKLMTILPASPEAVAAVLRDHRANWKLVPGLRSLQIEAGAQGDTLHVEFKPHPMIPLIEQERRVTVANEADGDVRIESSLVSSSYDRIESQSSEWLLLRLGDAATLAIYEIEDRYKSLPFRKRVLEKLEDGTLRLVDDVRERCAAAARVDRVRAAVDEARGGL